VPVAFAWERRSIRLRKNATCCASRSRPPHWAAAGRLLNLVLLLDNSGSMERADGAIIHEALACWPANCSRRTSSAW